MVIRRVCFIGIAMACILALIGCATAPAAPAAPAAPQSSLANPPVAPAAGASALKVPPQPTAPPAAPGAPYTWQTAVPAVIVAGPTLVPANTPTPGAAGAATKVPTAAPTAAVTTAAIATAPGVATGKKTDAKFTFTPALATVEDVDPLDAAMKKVTGIFESASSQTSSVVTYDAGLITVDQIMQAFALQGHPVKPQ